MMKMKANAAVGATAYEREKRLLLSQKRALYTLSQTGRFYCVTSYLTEKLSKLRSFDRQQRSPQNCPFQSSFTQTTVQFTQGIPQFPQFTCPHHDGIISRHIRFQQIIQQMSISRYPFQIPLLTPHFTLSFLLFG